MVLINFIITYFFAVKSETSNKKEEEKSVENTDTKWVSNFSRHPQIQNCQSVMASNHFVYEKFDFQKQH